MNGLKFPNRDDCVIKVRVARLLNAWPNYSHISPKTYACDMIIDSNSSRFSLFIRLFKYKPQVTNLRKQFQSTLK